MTALIHQLATIEVGSEAIALLKADDIYRDFSYNFKKLDELKEFRSSYEKQNWLVRWWDNNELKDAQLDSAEVQAAFSKTMGQLMMIGIVQSKQLLAQQKLLNEQQLKLNQQAQGIADQTRQIDTQQQQQVAQTAELRQLIDDYFQLKGLTERASEALLGIASEMRGIKEETLTEVSRRLLDMRQSQDGDVMRMDQQIEALRWRLDGTVPAAIAQGELAVGIFAANAANPTLLRVCLAMSLIGFATGAGALIVSMVRF